MSDPMVYIGRDAEGTILLAMMVDDRPIFRKELAKAVKQGMSIEQVPLSWIKGQKRLFTKDRYSPTPPVAGSGAEG